MNRLILPLLAATLLLVAGCGPRGDNAALAVYPAAGNVLLPGGQPAGGARIRFVGMGTAGGAEGIALIGSDGTFAMKSLGEREGMMRGKYKVVLIPGKT